ncbi:MAG: efflux RND transporter periplasmic adaptor subunit [Nitrospira sp.]|nr:efflux RND transporter periplasmic adaptor subunit [Nitrospira sp.]
MVNVGRVVLWTLVVGLVVLVLASFGLLKEFHERDELVETSSQTAPPSSPNMVTLKAEVLANAGIEVVPVVRGEFLLHREFPATVQPNENELAEVTTLIRGRVVEVSVDVGQDVKKGTLLAWLHSTDLGLKEGAYLKAAAKLHEAELSLERAKELYEHKAVSLAELQRREAVMKTARAEVRESKNHLELIGVPREEIERLDREQTIKADVPLRAPFDGRVIMRNLTRGEVVETTQKLFTVADLSDVWVVGRVPEKDVRFIHREQVVEVRATAYPGRVFSGTITYISDVLDSATRTMQLRVTVPNPKKLLKPEMFATVRVYAEPEPEAVLVPVAAVQRSSEPSYVFVQLDGGRFEKRPVVLGPETDQVVSVMDGLRDGERIVTTGTFVLRSEFEKSQIEPAP